MAKKYPRLNSRRKYKGPGNVECECCKETATGTVCVEFTYMRGEDEVYKACDRHFQMAGENLSQFLKEADKKFRDSKL